ncbi:MAG: glycosyltransferase 87 family protein [Candidatus Eremiobacterota bacterium]
MPGVESPLAQVRQAVREQPLLVAYVLLATGVWAREGHYSLPALVVVLSGFVIAVEGLRASASRPPGWKVLLACLGMLLVMNLYKPPSIRLESALYVPAYRSLCAVLLLIVVGGLTGRWLRGLVVLGLVGAVLFRLWMPIASPGPDIDVFHVSQAAAECLEAGRNPYRERLSQEPPFHYVYPPSSLYAQTLAHAAFGDVRYASVLADLVVAICLVRLALRRWSRREAALLALVWLYHPCGLLVVGLAWTEPLLAATLALALVLLERRTAAAVVYGGFLSLKQYLLFFGLHWFLLERSWKRILLGLATACLSAAPFAAWDWGSLWSQGVLSTYLNVPPRPDSLSLSSVLYPWLGPPPKSLTVLVGAITAVGMFLTCRGGGLPGYCRAVTITTFAMFLFGAQAYCNYYDFVGALLLLTLACQSYSDVSSLRAR